MPDEVNRTPLLVIDCDVLKLSHGEKSMPQRDALIYSLPTRQYSYIATAHSLASRDQAPCLLRGLPAQRVLVAADGGQIAWTPATAALNEQCRFAVLCGKARQISALLRSIWPATRTTILSSSG